MPALSDWFVVAVLRLRGGGDLLVLLEHGLLQPGVPAGPLDAGTQAQLQAARPQGRQGVNSQQLSQTM